MIRTKLALKVLTKEEQEHLTKDGDIKSMKGMEKQIKYMKKLDPKRPGNVCWECWEIGRKLGIVKD